MAKGPKPLRNWAAMNPLMRKGGAHTASRQHTRPRLDWREALDEFIDWQDSATEEHHEEDNKGAKAPSFRMDGLLH